MGDMKRALFTLSVLAASMSALTFQGTENTVVIHTDRTGTVTKIEGVKVSQISIDKLGIVVSVPGGTNRVTVKTPKDAFAQDGDFMKFALDLQKKDPYALKYVIHSDGRQAVVMGADGKRATKPGEDGGAGTAISFEGEVPNLTTVVRPKVDKIRIAFLAPDGLDKFKKTLAQMKKN
jgi:hypothetical protein